MTLLLLILLILTTTTHALRYEEERVLQKPSPLWNPNENRQTYVHFPEEMKGLLDDEFHTLMRSPQLQIFTTVPEPADKRVWPLVKGMMLRNHLDNKILWAKPNYLITDGLEYGCRQMVEGQEQHVPVPSSLCEDHCLHQGRYCAPFEPARMPAVLPAGFKGKELVKESLRRLCFDHYYHASDTKYFEYLEGFDRKQCLQQPDVTQCAREVINEVDHADYSNFAECVGDDKWDQDIANEQLEHQLKDAKKWGTTLQTVPEVRIGNVHYEGEFTTAGIFAEYCNDFDELPMHPVSCDVCGKCQDVRQCLWTLECDGQPFDANAFLKVHGNDGDVYDDGNEESAMDEEKTVLPKPTAKPTNAVATLPPGGVSPQLSTTDNYSEEQYGSSYGYKQDKNENLPVIMLVSIIAVAALLVGFITFRDRRSQFLMAQIQSEQQLDGYRDNEGDMYYVDDSLRSNNADDDVELSPTNNKQQPPKMAFLPEMT